MAESEEELKSVLMKVKKESGKVGNSVRPCVFRAQKSLQIVIAAMKLRDAYVLGEKL